MPVGSMIPVAVKITTKINNATDKPIRNVKALSVFCELAWSLCFTKWNNAEPKLAIIATNAIIMSVLINIKFRVVKKEKPIFDDFAAAIQL